jgi:uncharacterized membrane protein HdeD (DUF308 family)
MFKSTSTSLILLGVLAIIVGILALAWPGVTVLALVILFAVYAFIDAGLQAMRAFTGGFFEIFAGFRSSETAGTRALFILGGLVSIAFGAVLFSRPGVGAVTIALLFGLFSLIYGISQITLGIQLRQAGQTRHSVLEDAA